ncbi:MAG: hypothetical protein LBK82_09000 [Planctomycetaceae bacterium]|jgi:hypothetical protein|nr:hypothetical protein [Planctomycetaceae bacterium]
MSTPPSNIPFKNLGLARVRLIPVTVLDPEATTDPIELNCTSKSLPGFEDAPTWQILTDNPEQQVAETIKGKLGGMTALEFTENYDPVRQVFLSRYLRAKLTVEIVYDDPYLDFIAAITIPNCELLNPGGGTSGGETNSAGTMVIKVQPRGGGTIADLIQIETTDRAPS